MAVMIIQYYFAGFFACIIAALPLGLVNLNVMETTIKKSKNQARYLSFGAALVEIHFAAIALFFGDYLKDYFSSNLIVNASVFIIVAGAAFYFFIRKQKEVKIKKNNHTEFIKGMALNLVSLQVLSFWIIASIYLLNEQLINLRLIGILFFLSGVLSGKLLTLEGYIIVAIKASNKINYLPAKMNKIMGTIFTFLALGQFFKLILQIY